MDKQTLLAQLRAERERLDAVLATMASERLLEPGAAGEWSVKDVIAHLTVYERWLTGWLQAARRGQLPAPSPVEDPEVDVRNRLFHALAAERPLDEVRAEARVVFEALLAEVAAVSEADLDDPERTAWCVLPFWKDRRALWQAILNDTAEHYQQHLPDLETWAQAGQPQKNPMRAAMARARAALGLAR
jgi:hypothetical protein